MLVGEKTSADKWRQQIDALADEKGWIAQEYFPPDPVVMPNHHTHEIGLYQFVWGVFAYGEKYQGTFIRAASCDNDSGVINSTNNSLEFLIFEE